MDRWFATAIALWLCGCGTSTATGDGGDPPDGPPRDGDGRMPGGDGPGGGDSGFPDVACSGSVSGGLAGTLSDCPTSYVFGYSNGTRYTTAVTATKLNGGPLDSGPCELTFELMAAPDTSTTYTFDNIRGGVSNLYQNHPSGPETIWACGSTGTVTYGSGLALAFTTVDYVGDSSGTPEYKVHGHVACHYAADDGSAPIDAMLTF